VETIELQVNPRETRTKGAVKQLRRAGKIPAIFYGPKSRPVALQIESRDFVQRVANLEGSHLIRMKSEKAELADKVALVKDIQFHPVSGTVLHVDLYEVDLAQRIRVKVPLHFEGKAAGVVRGGILQPVVREIEVESLPMEIPEYLSVDVTALDIGDSLHVSDLKAPPGVEIVYETDYSVVTVVPPTVEKAPAVEAAPPVEGAVPEGAPAEEKESPES
jgi:large subunit ribosomal protein L25